MENVFEQPKELWELSFSILYKDLSTFEDLFEEIGIAVSSHEISSKTVESLPEDLWRITVFFSYKPSLECIEDKFLSLIQKDSVKITQVEQKDWTKEVLNSLGDIKTDKFHIIRSKNSEDSHLIPILINLTRAFGTGEHATTLGCLKAMEKLSRHQFTDILDIGTGTGVLAIAAKKLWPSANVTATDIDEVAIEVSRTHAAENKVSLELHLADGASSLRDKGFDLIFANILARPLIEMAEDIVRILRPGGFLILSGFLENQSDEILSKYIELGCSVVLHSNHDQWISATLSRV
jgi:ribosomal protein L11 methyltransferase